MRIEGAELTIYTDEGNDISIDLSPMQLKAVIGMLGITSADRNSISCFSDESLKVFYEKTVGKWTVVDK